ncbi:MAG: type II toxin-antitoxin system VapC family toxin [Candidatus Levybacteria bacterium]|nr:type II toxin-antitoxin system VapC family toxin [Candidatus Levybacteria bacterium]
MKQSIFIDTNFLCALYNEKDALHEKARGIWPTLDEFYYTVSNFILLEAYTILSQRVSKTQAIFFGNYVRKENPYTIFWIDRNLENDIWEIFKLIKDKDFSYVDASILAVMKKEKIKHLLSFDAGFKNLQEQFKFNLHGA